MPPLLCNMIITATAYYETWVTTSTWSISARLDRVSPVKLYRTTAEILSTQNTSLGTMSRDAYLENIKIYGYTTPRSESGSNYTGISIILGNITFITNDDTTNACYFRVNSWQQPIIESVVNEVTPNNGIVGRRPSAAGELLTGTITVPVYDVYYDSGLFGGSSKFYIP